MTKNVVKYTPVVFVKITHKQITYEVLLNGFDVRVRRVQVISKFCYFFVRCIFFSRLCFEGASKVSFLFSEFSVVSGQFVEGQLQLFYSLLLRRLLRLAVNKEQHQTGDDQRLDQRREEKHNPHVVATTFPFGFVFLFGLQTKRRSGVAVVHVCGPTLSGKTTRKPQKRLCVYCDNGRVMKIFCGDGHTRAVDGMSTVLVEHGAVAVFINVRGHFTLLSSFRVLPGNLQR